MVAKTILDLDCDEVVANVVMIDPGAHVVEVEGKKS